MGNTNYKPLFTGGGGSESIIFTTSKDKPTMGEEGKLYLFTDENLIYWWDKTTNEYKTLGSPQGGRYSTQGVSIDKFPYPGVPDLVYVDGNGRKYIWTPGSGKSWRALGFVRAYAEQQTPPVGIPYYNAIKTSAANYQVVTLPKMYIIREKDADPEIIDVQIGRYLISEHDFDAKSVPSPSTSEETLMTLQGYWAAMPYYRYSLRDIYRWDLIQQGVGTPVYQLCDGCYTPVS